MTRVSRSYSEIDDGILNQIAKQIWVDLSTLKSMESCEIDRDGYITTLQEQGRLS